MDNDDKYVCKRRKVGDVYEIECKSEERKDAQPKKKKMYCVFTTEGKSGGASGLGFGGQYGKQTPVLKCFSEDEFKKEIAKELGTKERSIKIVNEDK